MDKIAFFLPTRKGSERVKNKNTRPFAGMDGGLIENKIRQLLGTKLIDEIILSTNDEKCMEVAQNMHQIRDCVLFQDLMNSVLVLLICRI